MPRQDLGEYASRKAIAWFVLPFCFLGLAKLFITNSLAPPAIAAEIEPISENLVPIYQAAAKTCPNLDWRLLAAIGRIESSDGKNLIGIRLDGRNNTAIIRDTDGGRIDGDKVYDRAVGVMQCIPETCTSFAVDANKDGTINFFDPYDGIYTAVNYLCANGAADPKRLETAILNYNHSSKYLHQVLDLKNKL